MCVSCWDEYGRPLIDTERTRAAAKLITDLHEEPDGVVGGHFHIVTDDWNLGDDSIRSCIDHSTRNVGGFGDEQLAIERQLGDLLLTLTEVERASALAIAEGYTHA